MNKLLTSKIVVVFLFAGCSFRSPSLEEQQYLISKGAFPGGVPEWVATPRLGINPGAVASSGLIPSTYSASGSHFAVGHNPNTAALPTNVILPKVAKGGEFQGSTESAVAEPANQVKKDLSPLDKISSTCPGLDSQVNDALLTTSASERIAKYVKLTNRCQNSSELWLWLARDYQKINKYVESARCYEKVLVLDFNNKEASAQLAVVKSKLSDSGSEPAKSDSNLAK